MEGLTPDSLLALHSAGYEAVVERLGRGVVLDLGCGQGFESVRLAGEGRVVVGVDYDHHALIEAALRQEGKHLLLAQMDASRLALTEGSVEWVCSSHLIEHFVDPSAHVSEIARVLADEGTAFVLTPNAPADFENPFHVHLFEADSLRKALEEHFLDVWIGGLDAVDHVKEDFRRRRERAERLLSLDFLGLRRRIPRSWYVGAYTRLLPLAYRILARSDTGGSTGITSGDFFVTDHVDSTTLVLFAIARSPRRQAKAASLATGSSVAGGSVGGGVAAGSGGGGVPAGGSAEQLSGRTC